MRHDFSATHIRNSVEVSLRRLKTDYIDLYQLHSPPLELLSWDEVISTLELLKQEGKIRLFGISARSPGDAKTAVERFGFSVVQVNFNLIDHRAMDDGLFEICRQKNVGVIVRTPLCFGFLSGELTGDEEFLDRDHRANWPREQLRRWAKAPQLFMPLNKDKKRTLVQLALKFCLSDGCVSTVIAGMMTGDEVRENVAAADLPPLTQRELKTIRGIYRSHAFYDSSIKQEALRAKD
ncbi:MAG: aldo/keto reductase, partial [Chloroflexota bacterium]